MHFVKFCYCMAGTIRTQETPGGSKLRKEEYSTVSGKGRDPNFVIVWQGPSEHRKLQVVANSGKKNIRGKASRTSNNNRITELTVPYLKKTEINSAKTPSRHGCCSRKGTQKTPVWQKDKVFPKTSKVWCQ